MQFKRAVSIILSLLLLNFYNWAWPARVCAQTEAHDSRPVLRTVSSADVPSASNPRGLNRESEVENEPSQSLAFASPFAREQMPHVPAVEKYLIEGRLQAGERDLQSQLNLRPDDDQLRFGLGTLQFLRAVEQLAQDLYRYGLRTEVNTDLSFIPLVRLPLPINAHPNTLSYQQAQTMVKTFLANLAKADATLAPISSATVKLPLHFGLIRLDLNGDGHADADETLWKLYAGLNNENNISAESARKFYIGFDRGDVHWLRGYCHLLMAICDVYLAHDTKETFDCTAHMFFPKVDSPYKFLSHGKQVFRSGDYDVLDLVALIHTIRWRVAEPERMNAALHHLEAVVAQSKESWKFIMAETDDDHEWLPNPRQTGVIPNVHVSKEMVDTWQYFMSEAGNVLEGKLLIPFWRADDGRGVNLRKVFTEPRTLDLVLWVQGSAAAPYLQNGPKTKEGLWRRLQDAFGDNFPGFAVYFN